MSRKEAWVTYGAMVMFGVGAGVSLILQNEYIEQQKILEQEQGAQDWLEVEQQVERLFKTIEQDSQYADRELRLHVDYYFPGQLDGMRQVALERSPNGDQGFKLVNPQEDARLAQALEGSTNTLGDFWTYLRTNGAKAERDKYGNTSVYVNLGSSLSTDDTGLVIDLAKEANIELPRDFNPSHTAAYSSIPIFAEEPMLVNILVVDGDEVLNLLCLDGSIQLSLLVADQPKQAVYEFSPKDEQQLLTICGNYGLPEITN